MLWGRRMLWWIAAAIIAIALVRWLVRAYEARLAFFPSRGENATPAAYGVLFTVLNVTTADGEQLRGWHLARENPRAQIVYFHGNGGNLSLWSDVLVALWQQGYDVVAFDYRGYGASTGAPSERGLYRDVDAIVAFVHERLGRPGAPLIYWGRSLGTTMAAYATTLREPAGVVLEAGFPSVRAVVRSSPILWALSWFSSYEFPTARWLSAARAPVLVLHGDADSVIPYRLGQQLYAALRGRKQFVTIRGGDHNDLTPRDPKAYWDAVATFVADLQPLTFSSRRQ
jgi:fermentation-respiration switch protein FrsA (DUF1100 family)